MRRPSDVPTRWSRVALRAENGRSPRALPDSRSEHADHVPECCPRLFRDCVERSLSPVLKFLGSRARLPWQEVPKRDDEETSTAAMANVGLRSVIESSRLMSWRRVSTRVTPEEAVPRVVGNETEIAGVARDGVNGSYSRCGSNSR
jgi:hypothetical protein